MGWTIFALIELTLIDLYVGLVLLDRMAASVPPEKLSRLNIVRQFTIILLAACGAVLLIQVGRGHGWLRI